MNEYNLREKAAALLRTAQRYQDEIPKLEAQIVELTKQADAISLNAATRARQHGERNPAALIAAEKALNSNSAFLMRQRADALHEAARGVFSRACELEKTGDPAGCQELCDLGTAWEATRTALEERATLLERRAAERLASDVARKEDRERRRREREDVAAGLLAQKKFREQLRKDRGEA